MSRGTQGIKDSKRYANGQKWEGRGTQGQCIRLTASFSSIEAPMRYSGESNIETTAYGMEARFMCESK